LDEAEIVDESEIVDEAEIVDESEIVDEAEIVDESKILTRPKFGFFGLVHEAMHTPIVQFFAEWHRQRGRN